MECPLFFEEDEVYITSKKGDMIGSVVESYINSFSDEDEFVVDSTQRKGKVRVAWYPSGNERMVEECKLKLIERSIMPGDIIRRTNYPDGQKGYATDCTIMCYLQVKGTNIVIANKDSRSLTEFYPYGFESIYVELDGWIGRTSAHQYYSATLEFGDGARCQVSSDDLLQFDDLIDLALNRAEDSEFASSTHYKGQQLKGYLCDLDQAHWIKSTKAHSAKTAKDYKKNRRMVVITVVDLEVEKVEVKWLFCGLSQTSALEDPKPCPEKSVRGVRLKQLRLLDPFLHATVQLGDSFYYTINVSDCIEKVDSCKKQSLSAYFLPRLFNKDVRTDAANVASSQAQEINVRNAEGSDGGDLCSADQIVTECTAEDGASEWLDLEVSDVAAGSRKGKTKRERRKKRGHVTSATSHHPSNQKPVECSDLKAGDTVAVEVILTESFIDVMWQDGSTEKAVSSRDLYCIYHLDDNEYFPGDYVVKADADLMGDLEEYGVIMSVDCAQRMAHVRWLYSKSSAIPTCLIQSTEISVYELKDHPNYTYRPGAAVLRTQFSDSEALQCCDQDTVGSVTRLHSDGTMSVRWADGCISLCYPEQLLLIANMHESDDSSTDSETSSSLSSSSSDFQTDYGTAEESSHDADSSALPNAEIDWSMSIQPLMARLSEALNDLTMNVVTKPTLPLVTRLIDLIKSTTKTYRMFADFFSSGELSMHAEAKKLKAYQHVLRSYNGISAAMDQLQRSVMQEGCGGAVLQRTQFLSTMIEEVSRVTNVSCDLEDEYLDKVLRLVQTCLDRQHEDIKEQLKPVQSHICPDELVLDAASGTSPHMIKLPQIGDLQSPSDCDVPSLDAGSANLPDLIRVAKLEPPVIKQEPEDVEDVLADSADCESINNQDLLIKMKEIDDLVAKYMMEGTNTCTKFLVALGDMIRVEPPLISNTSENSLQVAPQDDKPSEMILYNDTENVVGSCCEVGSADSDDLRKPYEHLERITCQGFKVLASCPPCHKYANVTSGPCGPSFVKSLTKQVKALCEVPEGIMVRAYEDRMDLLSAMIAGPAGTPYEDSLFIFDVWMQPNNFPMRPPVLFFHSYCSERLNPNLYVDGKVCVSLLGTWSGKSSEIWNPATSTLLQVLVSLQGLILVKEPYYNEAGYERQKGTSEAFANSKKYNEMVQVNILKSMIAMIENPHAAFKDEILTHWKNKSQRFKERQRGFIASSASSISENELNTHNVEQELSSREAHSLLTEDCQDFPLLPLSKGCSVTLSKLLPKFEALTSCNGEQSL